MKKLTKLFTSSTMLVGLAACGATPAPKTWADNVKDFLAKSNLSIELPDAKALDGLTVTVEESEETEEYWASIDVSATGEVEDIKTAVSAVFTTLLRSEDWAIADYDEDYYDYGMFEYVFQGDFNNDGNYVSLDVFVVLNALIPEIVYEIEMDEGIYLSFSAAEGYAASDVEELLAGVLTENLGYETETLLNDETSLEDIAPFWTLDASYGDGMFAYADTLIEELDAYSSWVYDKEWKKFGDEVCVVLDGSAKLGATQQAIADALKPLLAASELGFELVEDFATKEGVLFAEYTILDGAGEALVKVLPASEHFQVQIGLYSVSKELAYINELTLSTFDAENELAGVVTRSVNEDAWEIDTSYANTYGNFALSNEHKGDSCLWAQYLSDDGLLKLNIKEDDAWNAWPTDTIKDYAAGFTTEVPALDGSNFWCTVYSDGVVVNTLDHVKGLTDAGSYAQDYLELVDETLWDVEEVAEGEFGVPCYQATSKEENADGKLMKIEFFTYSYQFYCLVQLVDAPKPWDSASINAWTEESGFETVIPVLEGQDLTTEWNDDYDSWVVTFPDKDGSRLAAYMDSLPTTEWTVDLDSYGDKEAKSVEVSESNKIITIYSWTEEGVSTLQILLTPNRVVAPMQRLNSILAEQGWEGVVLPDFSSLGEVCEIYKDEYDEETDTYTLSLFIYGSSNDVWSVWVGAIQALVQNEVIAGIWQSSGYYICCGMDNTGQPSTSALWIQFKGYQDGLQLYIEIGQNPNAQAE